MLIIIVLAIVALFILDKITTNKDINDSNTTPSGNVVSKETNENSSNSTTTTTVYDDGTTVITTNVKEEPENIDVSNLSGEDEGEEKREEDDDVVFVGNGEGDSTSIDIPTWQNRIENDVLYEKPFSMYSIGNVNVRLTPVICDNIIDLKEPGERVEVLGESEDGLWFRIKYGDWYAYVIKEWFSTSKLETNS